MKVKKKGCPGTSMVYVYACEYRDIGKDKEPPAGAIYICHDAAKRLAPLAWVVCTMGDGTFRGDTVQHGVFWRLSDARLYAEAKLTAEAERGRPEYTVREVFDPVMPRPGCPQCGGTGYVGPDGEPAKIGDHCPGWEYCPSCRSPEEPIPPCPFCGSRPVRHKSHNGDICYCDNHTCGIYRRAMNTRQWTHRALKKGKKGL